MNRSSIHPHTPGWIRDTIGAWPVWSMCVVVLWPFWTLKEAFILSDYWAQHYPWALHTFNTIRSGHLPLWTDLMTCGFPLMAEGQAAVFYLPHMAGYTLLPFLWTYILSVPLHMVLGAAGLFAYLRAVGASRAASSIGAICFTFGSGFAGCFYNTGSLRTLAWLPCVLWMLERMRGERSSKKKFFYGMLLGVVFSQVWTAGFSQMAVYLFLYAVVHEGLCGLEESPRPSWTCLRPLIAVMGSILIGTALALIQLVPTFELIAHSVRRGESASFALWGSVPPPAWISLIYPEWGNALRVSFYIGVLPVFLILAHMRMGGFLERGALRRHLLLAGLFLLLSLGRFNPIYGWSIEFFHLTFLRNPAKFLFFAGTSLSILAGLGLDRAVRVKESLDASRRNLAERFMGRLAWVVVALPMVGALTSWLARSVWPSYSRWYVQKLVDEKGALAKEPSYYLSMMDRFFLQLGPLFSYANPHNLRTIGAALLSAFLMRAFWAGRLGIKTFVVSVQLLVAADLYLFSLTLGTGFTGNFAPLERLVPPAGVLEMQKHLKGPADKAAEFVGSSEREWLFPNANMIYGIAHPGGYSPLLLKNYYELYHDLGMVDGSLGRPGVSEAVWARERALLDLAGVKLLHSDRPLDLPGLTQIHASGDFFLYENESALPEAGIFYRTRTIPGADERIRYLQSADYRAADEAILAEPPGFADDGSSGHFRSAHSVERSGSGIRFRISTETAGIGWARVAAYPGWTVRVDGKRVEWFPVNHAFIGFRLGPGEHEVRLSYEPSHWKALSYFNLAAWVLAGALTVFFFYTAFRSQRILRQ